LFNRLSTGHRLQPIHDAGFEICRRFHFVAASHVLGQFRKPSSPGGLGVVNFPDNHFTGHAVDEDK
jgi:hypothetical protein